MVIQPGDIRRMLVGHFTMPAGSTLPGHVIVVCAYVIRHPKGYVLFDTGIGRHEEAEWIFRPVRRDVRDALAEVGVVPEDIRAIANCHFHIDHAGGNPSFPNRPIFAQRAEFEAVAEQDYTNPEVVEFDGATFELHEGDAVIDDGITVIPTPGHTPGHQSLVVETTEGRIVLAGQAFNDASDYGRAHYEWHLRKQGAPSGEVEVYNWVGTIQERYDPRRVLFAHDLAVWERPDVLT